MVVCPNTGGVSGSRGAVLAAMAVLLWHPAAAQTARTALADVNRRSPPNQIPALEGKNVKVRGVVNAPAFHFPNYNLLGIQDGLAGVVLQVEERDPRLDAFHPGDILEVDGAVANLAGAVTIVPARITVAGYGDSPAAVTANAQDLWTGRFLGLLVRTEGRIKKTDETTAGAYLDLDTAKGPYRLFLPRTSFEPPPDLSNLQAGDRIQASGVAHQYCPRMPYDHYYELLVSDPAQIIPLGRPRSVSPFLLASVTGLVLLISFLLWRRESGMLGQRERMRQTYHLGEEILGAASTEAILKRITEALPGILSVTRVRLYIYNRAAKTLDAVRDCGGPVSISLSSPPGGTQAGAVACFHYSTLLVIPDIDRSPFPIVGKDGDGAPKSLLFVPMMAQGEVIGVLELDQDDRVRDFTPDEQSLAQHLANQIGVAMRLLDQRTVQEQLYRTEKMAAVGRLISGIVNELQTPLSSISDLAGRALEKSQLGPAEREVSAISEQARKASAMVARLVSFAAGEQVEARPVSVSSLLRTLIDFRGNEWKASGIRVRDLTTREPLLVLGSEGQLEQVFLTLMVHAEQALANAPQKVITIRTSLLAKRLLVEIEFTAAPESRKPEETASVLGVTRSVVAGHGGEVRLIDKPGADPHFEVELPVASKERAAAAATPVAATRTASGTATALVIEPDDVSQRQLLALMATRGFRVVPVTNSDTGLELAQRIKFDAAFCSIHAPGLNWVELSERMQSRVGGFVLLSDGYDAELSADFEGEGRFVLPKPVQEGDLDRVLQAIEPKAPPAQVIPITRSGVA